jgi:hypothetical protein
LEGVIAAIALVLVVTAISTTTRSLRTRHQQ